jgi:hypothetical protein
VGLAGLGAQQQMNMTGQALGLFGSLLY